LGPGDPLVVGDGAGAWRPCRFGRELEPAGEVRHQPAPGSPVTVGFTPTKGDRPEWAVQKLTELGVDRILVLRSERSVVRWEADRAVHHLERLARIAREAAMQSRRAWLPRIEGVLDVREALAEPAAVLADRGGRPPRMGDTVVLTGPEGGWTERERAAAGDRMALGPAVLRAETAAVAAAVLVVALREGLVHAAGPNAHRG